LPQALSTLEGWETVVFGAVLMLCMIFMRKGLVPTLHQWWQQRQASANGNSSEVQS
jgi:ABC-type branched-subunit amino acid transport system permease subunit